MHISTWKNWDRDWKLDSFSWRQAGDFLPLLFMDKLSTHGEWKWDCLSWSWATSSYSINFLNGLKSKTKLRCLCVYVRAGTENLSVETENLLVFTFVLLVTAASAQVDL